MAQGAQEAQPPVRDQPNLPDRVDQASMFNPTDLLYQISCLGMSVICIGVIALLPEPGSW